MYETVIKIVRDRKTPVMKVSHGRCDSGEEKFVSRFSETVIDICSKEGVEGTSLPCICSAAGGGLGHEATAVIADLMTRAFCQDWLPGQYRVGSLTSNDGISNIALVLGLL